MLFFQTKSGFNYDTAGKLCRTLVTNNRHSTRNEGFGGGEGTCCIIFTSSCECKLIYIPRFDYSEKKYPKGSFDTLFPLLFGI